MFREIDDEEMDYFISQSFIDYYEFGWKMLIEIRKNHEHYIRNGRGRSFKKNYTYILRFGIPDDERKVMKSLDRETNPEISRNRIKIKSIRDSELINDYFDEAFDKFNMLASKYYDNFDFTVNEFKYFDKDGRLILGVDAAFSKLDFGYDLWIELNFVSKDLYAVKNIVYTIENLDNPGLVYVVEEKF